MSELQHETGYIAKVLTSPKNAQWRGYVFQRDDNKVYSVILSDKVPADLRAELAILTDKDYVTFHYKESTGKDNKTYYNIYGLERPEKQQEEPDNDQPSPTPKTNVLDGMTRCNITQVAGAIYRTLIKKSELAEQVDLDVLSHLLDVLADWHRKNAG